jgi:DNA-binding transcriptional LysR family regulator
VDLLAGLGTFVRVVDAGSLSAAARALRLSLPAVSRQLRALEEELRTPLILRSTRRMSLTEGGRHWYESARRVQAELAEARAQTAAPDQVRGLIVVSAPVALGMALVIPRLPRLAQRHPQLLVEVRLEDRLTDFISDGVDVAIRAGLAPPDTTSYVAHPFARFPRRVYAAPSYLKKHGTPRTPNDLPRHSCLRQVTPSGPMARWSLSRDGETREIEVQGPLRVNTPLALCELARAGAGLIYVPPWLAEADVAARRLRRVLPEWESAPVAAWAIHRVELRGSIRLRALLDLFAH